MAKPIYWHSGMAGAPQCADANRNAGNILAACLVNGFNTQAVSSASAVGGVLTLNYASDPGFEALSTVNVAGASVAEANGNLRVLSVGSNQVLLDAPGVPDGAVGGTIITKYAAAGWTEPFAANTQTRVFRMPGGSQRYFRVYHAVGGYALVRGYENMTALSTGTGPFPTTAQQAGNGPALLYEQAHSTDFGWWCLATDSGVYMQTFYTTLGYGLGWAYLGDPVQVVKAADVYAAVACARSGAIPYIARSHSGTGGAQPVTIPNFYTAQSMTVPSPIANGQRFLPGVLLEALNVCRGVLPNSFLAIPRQAPELCSTSISDVIGIDGRVRFLHDASSFGTIAIALDEDWA
ncbi:hypothetical protein KBW71_11575 [Hydrogenophaga aromaticivorans]|uniref:hypothetical protein n=1 Tax=Hydrogenophaga aromaticivorans TaxID=2610898 RepID=UPI001B362E6D|nr:hypothetical protein [Hydrogenophaga aromaticivorans]MBQ0919077.1 hypothetical protein [Hydrogenophaga aromaticivorans]